VNYQLFVSELNLIMMMMMILSPFRKLYMFHAKLKTIKKLITCKRMVAVYAGTMQVNGTMDPAVKTTQQSSLLIVDKTPGCEMTV